MHVLKEMAEPQKASLAGQQILNHTNYYDQIQTRVSGNSEIRSLKIAFGDS